MINWRNFSSKEKYFALILFLGFMVKYNFILLRIIYTSSITGVVFQNLIFAIVFIYFLIPLVKKKRGRTILYIGFMIFNLIFIANYWYNVYYGNYLSVADMIMGQGTGNFSLFEVLFKHILKFYDLFFLLDVVIISIMYFKNDFSSPKKYTFGRGTFQKQNGYLIPLLLILVLLFSQIYVTGSLLGSHSPGELYREGTSDFVSVYGFFPLYAIELYSHLAPYELTSEISPPPLMGGKLNGKQIIDDQTNIIVIQWESLDNKIINYEYGDREIAPFLNEIKEDSLYFNNFYSQHVNGSFDADFSFLTSLYPVNRNYTYRENDLTEFNSLARELKDRGYQTLAFHGNDREFFHRDQAFPELGFDHFYARDDYSLEDGTMEQEKTTLGINDYDFFDQSLDYLEEAEEPFFGFFITVSSHTPFDFYPQEENKEEFEEIENTLVKNFFNSIAFTDQSLEMFFEELKERGLDEDTLVIIYSDHQSGIEEEEYDSFRDFNLKWNVKQPNHIPLLIKHPEIEPGTIEQTGTVVDIAPTILDLLGREEKPKEFSGQSMLNREERPVLFLHEIPQILYRGQLFALEQGEFELIGHVEGSGDQGVKFSEEDTKNVLETIYYMRNEVFSRRREE
ncbi:MAG: LTA synthase family protein [Halanaerobiales bacterium]